MKRQLINERHNLQIIYLISGQYLDYQKDSYNSILKRQPFSKWAKSNRHFSTQVIQRVCRCMKKWSVQLVVRGMQFKATPRHTRSLEWLQPKSQIITSLGEDIKKTESSFRRWWERPMVQPSWEAIWQFFKKVNMELSLEPRIPFLGTHSRKERGTRVHRSIIHNRRWVKTTQMSINEWMETQ